MTLAADAADYLVLRRGTLWQMTPGLIDAGHLHAQSDDSDRRRLLIGVTAKGEDVATRCSEDLYREVFSIVNEGLPQAEFTPHMHDTIRHNLDVLRGHNCLLQTQPERLPGIRSEFLVFLRVVVQAWNTCVHQYAKLSFAEFRMLDAIGHTTAVSVRDLVDQLMMERTQVRVSRDNLARRGLIRIEQNPFDARSMLLAQTEQGRGVVASLLRELDRITTECHSLPTEGGEMVLSAWHARMYYNVRRLWERTNE